MLLGKNKRAAWAVGQRKTEGAASSLQPSRQVVAGEGASQTNKQSSGAMYSGKKTQIS